MAEETTPLKDIHYGKIRKGKFVVGKSRRAWEYEYKAMNGKLQKVKFAMKRSPFSGLTPNILKKDLQWKMEVEVYLYDYDEQLYYDAPRTILEVYIPNIYINRDPHKVLSEDEAKELCYSIMRETMFEWLQSLANGWKVATANESGAQEFEVEYKPIEDEPEKKEETSNESGTGQPTT